MEQETNFTHYDPHRLLDTVMQALQVRTDKQLALRLGVTHHLIKNLRAGAMPMVGTLLLLMADATGCAIEELRAALGDRRARLRVSVAATPAKATPTPQCSAEPLVQEEEDASVA